VCARQRRREKTKFFFARKFFGTQARGAHCRKSPVEFSMKRSRHASSPDSPTTTTEAEAAESADPVSSPFPPPPPPVGPLRWPPTELDQSVQVAVASSSLAMPSPPTDTRPPSFRQYTEVVRCLTLPGNERSLRRVCDAMPTTVLRAILLAHARDRREDADAAHAITRACVAARESAELGNSTAASSSSSSLSSSSSAQTAEDDAHRDPNATVSRRLPSVRVHFILSRRLHIPIVAAVTVA
jgi:hypothetical protein